MAPGESPTALGRGRVRVCGRPGRGLLHSASTARKSSIMQHRGFPTGANFTLAPLKNCLGYEDKRQEAVIRFMQSRGRGRDVGSSDGYTNQQFLTAWPFATPKR